jgi:3-methyl-2-oxobutanoate hydroxymethyltransferase
VDMPFGSYETNSDQAFLNAARIMQETGCQAVKIESGTYAATQISHMVERGIPVMGHVGLRPQAINVAGGFRAKGRNESEWSSVIAEAVAADQAGAFAIVVEGVAPDLADEITSAVSCPTIGIGASAGCDGQILVTNDLLGMTDWVPKFVKKNADLKSIVGAAAKTYAAEVTARAFPAAEQTYRLSKTADS